MPEPGGGEVGPDLTHVGGRGLLGAGRLETEPEDFAAWIRDPEALKPGVEMPAYDHMSEDELLALGTWLRGLR